MVARRMAAVVGVLLLAGGCGDKEDEGEETGDDTPVDDSGDGGEDWQAPEGGVIALETRDGVALAADYYPVDDAEAGAVILLHMNPLGGFQRKDWPEAFIAALTAEGWAVLNLDRRGAGDSEGEARDAIEGEGGRYDVEAAVLRVTGDGYGEVVIFGASNGTTSMIDYAAWAGEEGLPVPAGLGFLTGGDYTETNTSMAEVPVLPSIFVYADNEATWSKRYEGQHGDDWAFHELAGAGHGTAMLSGAAEEAGDLLVGFVRAR